MLNGLFFLNDVSILKRNDTKFKNYKEGVLAVEVFA